MLIFSINANMTLMKDTFDWRVNENRHVDHIRTRTGAYCVIRVRTIY